MRLFLLNYYLEQFRGTVYRQVMFAEFERWSHQQIESGEGLTVESMCDFYKKLNELYYGPDMVVDDQIALEWARIPHFYTAFYVYKYATGFSSAVRISTDILNGKEGACEAYLEFLKSGGSDYPLELLKKAGVDLTTSGPVDTCLSRFAQALDEFEQLLSE